MRCEPSGLRCGFGLEKISQLRHFGAKTGDIGIERSKLLSDSSRCELGSSIYNEANKMCRKWFKTKELTRVSDRDHTRSSKVDCCLINNLWLDTMVWRPNMVNTPFIWCN